MRLIYSHKKIEDKNIDKLLEGIMVKHKNSLDRVIKLDFSRNRIWLLGASKILTFINKYLPNLKVLDLSSNKIGYYKYTNEYIVFHKQLEILLQKNVELINIGTNGITEDPELPDSNRLREEEFVPSKWIKYKEDRVKIYVEDITWEAMKKGIDAYLREICYKVEDIPNNKDIVISFRCNTYHTKDARDIYKCIMNNGKLRTQLTKLDLSDNNIDEGILEETQAMLQNCPKLKIDLTNNTISYRDVDKIFGNNFTERFIFSAF